MAEQPATTTAPSAPAPDPVSVTAPQTESVGPSKSAEGVPQPEPQVAAAPEPVDPEYIARAGRWKLGEEDIRGIPRSTFERMQAAADAEVLENMARVRQGQPDREPPRTEARPQPVQSDSAPFKPIELKFDDMDDDSPIVTQAKAINEGMTKNLNDFYQWIAPQLNEVAEALKGMREMNDYAIMDRHLNNLGDDWKDVFGDGATVDLDPRSPQYISRTQYRDAVLQNLELDASLGRERDIKEAMLRARYRLHGQKISALERTKREAKAKEVAKGLPPPTGAVNGRAPVMGLRESVMSAFRK